MKAIGVELLSADEVVEAITCAEQVPAQSGV